MITQQIMTIKMEQIIQLIVNKWAAIILLTAMDQHKLIIQQMI